MSFLVWGIAALTVLAILVRPRGWPEAIWATLGAVSLVAFGLISPPLAASAIGKGTDVYLFLAGMMLLSELARVEGVFDWLAALALKAARGSKARLFTLVYGVGVLVTALLSNDATAVVLTPAVYTVIRRARTPASAIDPMPCLFACALIANAASFLLPISNPANLVLYGAALPALLPWLRVFLMPSIVSIATTYAVLYWLSRPSFAGVIDAGDPPPEPLSSAGKRAAWGIAGTAAVLLAASAFGLHLGLPTLVAASVAVLIATRGSGIPAILGGVSWSVLPLVAGLFVLVEAVDHAGGSIAAGRLMHAAAGLPQVDGMLATAFGVAAISNLINNLPSGLMTAGALSHSPVPAHLHQSLLLGIDLGPNLSVTGSLATILWLIVLRREGVQVSAWQFLRTGALVMPPALLFATLSLLSTAP